MRFPTVTARPALSVKSVYRIRAGMPTLGYPNSGFWRGLPAWGKDERFTGKELLWIAHHRQDGSAGAGYNKIPCPRIKSRGPSWRRWPRSRGTNATSRSCARRDRRTGIKRRIASAGWQSRSSTPSWRARAASASRCWRRRGRIVQPCRRGPFPGFGHRGVCAAGAAQARRLAGHVPRRGPYGGASPRGLDAYRTRASAEVRVRSARDV